MPAAQSTGIAIAGGCGDVAAHPLAAGLQCGGARACRVSLPAKGGLNAATAAAASGARAAAGTGPVVPRAAAGGPPLVAAGAMAETGGAGATAGAAGTPGGSLAAEEAAGRLACSSGCSSCRAPQGWSSGENSPGSGAPLPPPCRHEPTLSPLQRMPSKQISWAPSVPLEAQMYKMPK